MVLFSVDFLVFFEILRPLELLSAHRTAVRL
jgi:hypothetical protein